MLTLKEIAHIRSDFPEKFGIPRQSGLVEELVSTIVFEPEYRVPEALRGLEQYSHIWLVWEFSKAVRDGWSPTVRPPRLGGNTRMGVFATRSPFRPNPLGLSCVKIESIQLSTTDGPAIRVSGADLMDGTPIYDIKPYVVYADSHPDARSGFVDTHALQRLQVDIPQPFAARFTSAQLEALRGVLSLDPRPHYHNDPNKLYGMSYAGRDVRFRVADGVLTVVEVE